MTAYHSQGIYLSREILRNSAHDALPFARNRTRATVVDCIAPGHVQVPTQVAVVVQQQPPPATKIEQAR
jgi:hypothetical protein